jgi:dihydrofolate reductase
VSKLRVDCFGVSLDGFGAGPRQGLTTPLGEGGHALHQWFYPTDTWVSRIGPEPGETGVDNDFAKRGTENIGAWIMGRNMFGPVRGPWTDETWKGWWGENPPFHCDVFVLTRHARPSFSMEGDTTFHFVTDGVHAAYERAKAAAKGQDIRLGGGVSTVRQYLEAGLIDEMHLAVTPCLLGAGEPLLHGLDLPALGFKQAAYTPTQRAAHYVLRREP